MHVTELQIRKVIMEYEKSGKIGSGSDEGGNDPENGLQIYSMKNGH